jgi:Chitinase class I
MIMINKILFQNRLKTFGLFQSATNSQVSGCNDIIDAFLSNNLTDINQLAYILATVYHETAQKMQPVKEFGGIKYLMSKAYYPYYGRDLVQTTWKANYEKVKKFIGVDVVTTPDLIEQMPLAAKVAVVFMSKGWYTGKKLSDYINSETKDYKSARRIINGMDKADLIASHAAKFEKCLI